MENNRKSPGFSLIIYCLNDPHMYTRPQSAVTLCAVVGTMRYFIPCLAIICGIDSASAFIPTLQRTLRPAISPRSRREATLMPSDPQPEPQPDPSQPPPPRRTPVPMPTVGEGRDQMDVISRLLKDRILLLGQEVNDEVGNVLVAQLLYLASDDPEKDITLYINSPGGSVSAGLAIYDTIQVRRSLKCTDRTVPRVVWWCKPGTPNTKNQNGERQREGDPHIKSSLSRERFQLRSCSFAWDGLLYLPRALVGDACDR